MLRIPLQVRHHSHCVDSYDSHHLTPGRLVVDKGAAGRMIKHGLARTSTIDPNSSVPDADNQLSTSDVVPKITQKMVEREAYLKRLKEQDANSKGDEDHLEVFDDDTPAEPEPSTSATNAITDQDKSTSKSQKKKKKTSHSSTPKSSTTTTTTTTNDPPPSATTTSTSSKRKRPAIDPFAGYGDDRAPTPPAVDSRDSPSGSVDEAPGSTRKRSAADDGEEVGDSGTPQSSTPGSGKEKKRAKKARKAAS
ncbi:hypothetical protein AX16_000427 [Volvariella volvacea WC 439]|nr:hypothetical protein AX16_000427 [Volvariella volvacea WC 439]